MRCQITTYYNYYLPRLCKNISTWNNLSILSSVLYRLMCEQRCPTFDYCFEYWIQVFTSEKCFVLSGWRQVIRIFTNCWWSNCKSRQIEGVEYLGTDFSIRLTDSLESDLSLESGWENDFGKTGQTTRQTLIFTQD